MDWNSPIVQVLLLLLVAAAAVALLPAPFGWIVAGVCIIAAVAIVVGARGGRRPRV